MSRNKDPELWVINTTHDRDVSLADLRITIRKGAKVNLLDKRHYHFTDEQIRNSITTGSIYKKRHLIAVREIIKVTPKYVAPIEVEKNRRVLKPLRHASNQDVQAPYFTELDLDETMSEEQLAAEMADIDTADNAPVLPVDPKFK